MKIATIVKKLEEHKSRIAKDRDALTEFIDELDSLRENYNEAYDDISRAIDHLSEQV